MNDLRGKKVLVTGGGKGVGKGIALAFARLGAKVAIGCNSNAGMASETLGELKKLTDAVMIQSDISREDGCKKLVAETVAAFGGIDVLVSNAALQTNHSFVESSEEIIRQELLVNLRAGYLLLSLCHPYLKKSGEGRVIFISSVHGKRPTDFDVGYAMSKGGLEMLCREAAIVLADDHITCNIIAPGAVQIEGKTGDPKMFTVKPYEQTRRKNNLYPLGRTGLPSDAANISCFLAGHDAEFVTGTTIRVDGCAMLL